MDFAVWIGLVRDYGLVGFRWIELRRTRFHGASAWGFEEIGIGQFEDSWSFKGNQQKQTRVLAYSDVGLLTAQIPRSKH